jgi:predicted RNA methylase
VYSLAGYGRMVTDNLRTDAYAEALKREIKTGDVVVDIGTGPGILALDRKSVV